MGQEEPKNCWANPEFRSSAGSSGPGVDPTLELPIPGKFQVEFPRQKPGKPKNGFGI